MSAARPPPQTTPNVTDLVRGVATHGLPGTTGAIATDPPDDATWQQLLQRVDRQRLPGLLLAAIDDGALAVTDDQRTDALDRHRDAMGAVLHLEQRLVALTAALQADDIEVVALKGSAHAHLAYPDPSWRTFGDVDLLVPSAQLEAAMTTLGTQRGAHRQTPELRPGYDRRFSKSITLVEPDGTELDLHRTLVFGTFGFRIDLDELFASAVTFELGGQQIRALGPETRLLHTCFHAGLGDPRPRLSSIRDLAQMLLTGDHDPDRVIALADRWECQAVVARGLQLCREQLGIEVAGAIAERFGDHQPSRRDARAVDAYVGANRSHTAKVLASLPFIDDLRTRFAFVVGSAVPARSFADERGTDRRSWLRKGWRSLTRGRS
jgi:hypothetical protein